MCVKDSVEAPPVRLQVTDVQFLFLLPANKNSFSSRKFTNPYRISISVQSYIYTVFLIELSADLHRMMALVLVLLLMIFIYKNKKIGPFPLLYYTNLRFWGTKIAALDAKQR